MAHKRILKTWLRKEEGNKFSGTESELQAAFINYVHENHPGTLVVHLSGIGCLIFDHMLLIQLRTNGKMLDEMQFDTMMKLQSCGWLICVTWSLDEAVDIIESWS